MPTSPQKLVLASALLLLIGAFMPWVTLLSPILGISRTISGIDGDGIFTAIGGVILLIVSMASKGTPGKSYSGLGVIISILCFLLLIGKFSSIGDIAGAESGVIVSKGTGLYLSTLGSILGIVGSFVKLPLEETKSPAAEASAATEIPTQPKKENDLVEETINTNSGN